MTAVAHPGVLAIIRLRRHEPSDALYDALVSAGIHALEVTMPTPGALKTVRRWIDRGPATVGVGTVRTADDAAMAIDAGAQFLVTTTTVPGVVRRAVANAVPIASGALAPTEIHAAWQQEATWVKVFPVTAVGGPEYVRAVREPLDDVPLIPTGGVSADATRSYARLGCAGVGVGSALVSESLVTERDWPALQRRAARFGAAWRDGLADG